MENKIKITDFKVTDIRQKDSTVYINILVKGYSPIDYITLNIKKDKE